VLAPKLAADEPLQRVYRDIEMPLVQVLARIEGNGVLVDERSLRRQTADLGTRMHEVQSAAPMHSPGASFSLDSPKQLQRDPVRGTGPAGAW
jgi:DNA polymerase I